MRFLDLQVAGNEGGFATVLAGLAADVERHPAEVLPRLLRLADEASEARDFPDALMSLLLAEKAGYVADLSTEARAAGARAVELARQTGDVLAEAHAYRLLALVAFDEGRSKDGHDHLLDAMSAFDDAGAAAEVPPLMRAYGEHLVFLGALPEAEQALREAERRYRALGEDALARGVAADIAALAERKQ